MIKIFRLTNRCIVLATPLLLFVLLSGLYLIFAGNLVKGAGMLFVMSVLFAMLAAFLSGWCNMLKKAVTGISTEESYKLITEFVPGVGEYFLPVTGALFIWIVVCAVLMLISLAIGINFIGNPNISMQELSASMANAAVFNEYLRSLSHSQLLKLELWNILILCMVAISHFFVMLFAPVIFFIEKNPFKAFLFTLRDTFSKRILKTAGIYFSIFCLNFAVSILTAVSASNPVLSFIAMMLKFYFICYAALWIFDYYNSDFVGKNS